MKVIYLEKYFNKLNKSNLIIEGLSEKTIEILIKNSTALNWPNA